MITDPADLPGSHRRYDCSPQEYQLVLDTAIPELVRSGLSADTRDIAVGAGVPPTHPLLRDTRVLYDEAVRYAFRRLWPRPEDLDVERLVPAEAVRSLVRTAYRRHRADPDAVRLIISENVLSRGHLEGRNDVLETSPVVLQIDRVLMRGQDYGAFRPGISAEDVYVLITSLCCFPASQGGLFQLLYGTDMDHAATVEGLEKLACDTVLAFLTTSMPTTQGSSYTHAAPTTRTPSSVSASLYTAGDGGSVEEVVTYRAEDLPEYTAPRETHASAYPPFDSFSGDLGELGELGGELGSDLGGDSSEGTGLDADIPEDSDQDHITDLYDE
ncbi:TetR family transcriptional regulator [Corynebacterium sp. AOP40-9SA-29]|uniref:TetR family transcriptional regulator n=1 Tax=Corynebacterium sp. AOP40-9SA-29 TaxID=3457677 RepID=UPI0040349A6E